MHCSTHIWAKHGMHNQLLCFVHLFNGSTIFGTYREMYIEITLHAHGLACDCWPTVLRSSTSNGLQWTLKHCLPGQSLSKSPLNQGTIRSTSISVASHSQKAWTDILWYMLVITACKVMTNTDCNSYRSNGHGSTTLLKYAVRPFISIPENASVT